MLTDNRTNARYVVTEAGQSVAYVKNLNKKSISAIVPSNISFGNITYKVTSVAANAFSGCKKLKNVTVKTKVLKKIGKNVFKGLNKAAKIKVPKKKLTAYKKLFKKAKLAKSIRITR